MTASTADFTYEPQSDHLIVRAHTRYVIREKDAACQAIAAEIAARPIKAALVDLRGVPGPFTFLDRYGLGEAAGRHLAGTPIAAILTPEQVDPERIGQLAARNRGANVAVFTDEAEARAWLQPYLAHQG